MHIKAHMLIFDKKNRIITAQINWTILFQVANSNCIYSVTQQVQGKLYVKY